jgi:signal peptide peptidase-like protein 2B
MPMTPDTNPRMIPLFPPQEDSFLCSDIDSDHASNPNIDQPFVFVVPRGSCTFEHKALIAQMYGASGVIIHGTLSARYGFNETTHTIDYPLEYYDYDCSVTKGGGKIFIPTSKLIDINDGTQNKDQSNPMTPYNSANDYLLSGTKANGNLCAIYASGNNFESGCSSQRCLLTGNETVTSSGESMMEACCAWDTHVYLYRDGSMADPKTGQAYHPISIPAYFITMEEASSLIDSIKSNSVVYITMYTRWYPQYNLSTIVIWAVGVFVAAIASYLSASEIRFTRKRLEKRRKEHEDGSAQTDSHNGDTRTNASAVSMRGYERVVSNEGEESEYRRPIAPEETLELEPAHALFFIVFSSAGLLTLFFFKIYNVVKLFYAFGCSGAIMQIIVIPFYFHIARKLNFRDRVAFTTQLSESGSVTVIEALAIATSYGVGAVWIYIAFTVRHPETLAFFWIMQDIMGACMCILFLQTMKLNSIKVASMLLTAAFFYDIFFVFVTPYLTKGGKSIMVDVATSGGPPTADPSWCEKYPDGQECKGGGK